MVWVFLPAVLVPVLPTCVQPTYTLDRILPLLVIDTDRFPYAEFVVRVKTEHPRSLSFKTNILGNGGNGKVVLGSFRHFWPRILVINLPNSASVRPKERVDIVIQCS